MKSSIPYLNNIVAYSEIAEIDDKKAYIILKMTTIQSL